MVGLKQGYLNYPLLHKNLSLLAFALAKRVKKYLGSGEPYVGREVRI